jgi:hypothetical protein
MTEIEQEILDRIETLVTLYEVKNSLLVQSGDIKVEIGKDSVKMAPSEVFWALSFFRFINIRQDQ